jgi:glutamate racemase
MIETLSGSISDGAIGVFDSGVGGLTCVKELIRLMPHEDIVYLGDTARVPYGTRSRDTIAEYSRQDIRFMEQHNVKLLLVACGTVSAVMQTVPIFDGSSITCYSGVIIPAVDEACAVTKNGRIGVIGTAATIRSGAYGKAIRTIRQDAVIIGNACPLFVPLVENGITDKDDIVVKTMVSRYLEPIKRENVDTLILGCTHYPLLRDAIAEYMGESVKLISSGAEAAKYTMNMLAMNNMLSSRSENGHVTYFTSDSKKLFESNAHAFIGSLNGSVEQISIDDVIMQKDC